MEYPFAIVSLILFMTTPTDGIKARGTNSALIDVNAAKGHPQPYPGALLQVWCQAVDDQGRIIPLTRAVFKSKTLTHEVPLSGDKRNATLKLDPVFASEAGRWSCELASAYGNTSKTLDVYVRPIIQYNPNVRVDEKEGANFHLEVSGTTIVIGEGAELRCPVFGYPSPRILWKKDGKTLPGSVTNPALLKVEASSSSDEGVYTCTATNTIATSGSPVQYTLTIEQHLRVKNKLAWLTPFLVIVVTLVLLVATILFCECRKRSQRKRQDEE